MSEVWKEIPGFEGLYQVSNLGRVKSLPRQRKGRGKGFRTTPEKVLTPIRVGDYLGVQLCDLERVEKRYVHRLVAQSFLENMEGKREVNHIDEDKANNRVSNLEWCDHRYNINYGTTKERISIAHKNRVRTTRVLQIKDDIVIATFNTAAEAERQTGVDASAIRKVCLNRPKFITAGGYKWIEQETFSLF